MPPAFSQTYREMAVTVPGRTDLLLDSFSGSEGLSRLFAFDITVLVPASAPLAYDQVLGQAIVLRIGPVEENPRYIHGLAVRLAAEGSVAGLNADMAMNRYRVEIAPKLWLANLNQQSRVFQAKTVPEILNTVLAPYGTIAYQIQGTFEPREYCVQYRETDLAFASRLMEEEGIYYYFKHTQSGHQMVVANTPQGHEALPGQASVEFEPGMSSGGFAERVLRWEKTQEVRSGKVMLRDFTFETPSRFYDATKPLQATAAAGAVSHSLSVPVAANLTLDDYPGTFAKRFDGINYGGGEQAGNVGKVPDDGTRTTTLRSQEEAAKAIRVSGSSACRRLSAGHKMSLTRHPDANGDYVITHIHHSGSMGAATALAAGSASTEPSYENFFEGLPLAIPFRPARVTPRARVDGPQTAIVTGPAGSEIHTDKYGRVQVLFHWERGAVTSCWVRVGSPWAGAQWGGVHIPRVGQEVIVAFLEGDPDRPIIVGSVYNAEQMPPYTLPDNMTQSGFKTRSTTGGDAETFNELRFEDKKDEEHIYFHAEKDFHRVVENNDDLKVGFEKKDKGDQSIEIFNNQVLKVGCPQADDGSQTITIHKDRTATLTTGNETLTVKQGNRANIIETGNDTHTIKKGNREVTIEMGNDTLTIKMGNQTTKLDMGSSTTEAMQAITLKVGSSELKVDQMGISIKGTMVKIEGTGMLDAKAPMATVSGDGMLTLKGGIMMIN
jgi:type VI secretion system secreted protein VgrG